MDPLASETTTSFSITYLYKHLTKYDFAYYLIYRGHAIMKSDAVKKTENT